MNIYSVAALGLLLALTSPIEAAPASAVSGDPIEGEMQVTSLKPKNGLVPNQATAEGIAELVLFNVYGRQQIERQRPYKTVLESGVWTVRGTLGREFLGGTFLVRINQEDARIIQIYHER
jgi:hypothetical protein